MCKNCRRLEVENEQLRGMIIELRRQYVKPPKLPPQVRPIYMLKRPRTRLTKPEFIGRSVT